MAMLVRACCRRIYMTIVAGSAVGILGVEGWAGFAVYLLSQLLVSMQGQQAQGTETSRNQHADDIDCRAANRVCSANSMARGPCMPVCVLDRANSRMSCSAGSVTMYGQSLCLCR